jgi:hypothetical protein
MYLFPLLNSHEPTPFFSPLHFVLGRLSLLRKEGECSIIQRLTGGVEKVLFNRRARKVSAKHTKLRRCFSALCALCVNLLLPLRLMDFDFFDSPMEGSFVGIKEEPGGWVKELSCNFFFKLFFPMPYYLLISDY